MNVNSEFNYKFALPWSRVGTQISISGSGFNLMYIYLSTLFGILFKKNFYPQKLTIIKGNTF